ncbi:hypothetical protein PF001_g32568 [Phytophthora fragariae]|uniref:Uncharacterized protein n=1 Tax=Phytophthora fragariae TaxID=53985 RepID=A0A6A4AT41_9STRA|nr:hypothetical protein PF001_g32568 [Phytophthora fragariae]
MSRLPGPARLAVARSVLVACHCLARQHSGPRKRCHSRTGSSSSAASAVPPSPLPSSCSAGRSRSPTPPRCSSVAAHSCRGAASCPRTPCTCPPDTAASPATRAASCLHALWPCGPVSCIVALSSTRGRTRRSPASVRGPCSSRASPPPLPAHHAPCRARRRLAPPPRLAHSHAKREQHDVHAVRAPVASASGADVIGGPPLRPVRPSAALPPP